MNTDEINSVRCPLRVTALMLLAALVLGSCSGAGVRAPVCADRRMNLSLAMFERAKDKMAVHFQQRVDSALNEAYQDSQDSMLLAQATRNCHDFDEVIRRQAIDLIKSNLLFQKLVVSNMRDQDPGVVVDLYGNRYREIFKSDIQ